MVLEHNVTRALQAITVNTVCRQLGLMVPPTAPIPPHLYFRVPIAVWPYLRARFVFHKTFLPLCAEIFSAASFQPPLPNIQSPSSAPKERHLSPNSLPVESMRGRNAPATLRQALQVSRRRQTVYSNCLLRASLISRASFSSADGPQSTTRFSSPAPLPLFSCPDSTVRRQIRENNL